MPKKLDLDFYQPDAYQLASQRAGDMGKIPKSKANYQLAHFSTFEQRDRRCGNCFNLIPEKGEIDLPTCRIVAGPVNSTNTCRYFRRG